MRTIGCQSHVLIMTFVVLTVLVCGPARALDVYKDSTDAPRVTSKMPITLMSARDTPPQIAVRAEIAQLRLDTDRSRDTYFGTGRKTTTQKFPRITVSAIKTDQANLLMNISYTITEGKEDSRRQERVETGPVRAGRNIVIDLEGFTDVTGTEVDADYSGWSPMRGGTIVHTKTRYFQAKLTSIAVVVTDHQGAVLYKGDWSAPAQRSTGSKR